MELNIIKSCKVGGKIKSATCIVVPRDGVECMVSTASGRLWITGDRGLVDAAVYCKLNEIYTDTAG